MNKLMLCFASLLGFTSSVEAQRSAGPLVGAPLAAFVGPGTSNGGGPMNTHAFHRRRAGFDDWLTQGPGDTPADPLFTGSAMFGGGVPPAFRVNAFSLGLDEVFSEAPSEGVAHVNFAPGAWGVLGFSVARTTLGSPGSLIAQEVANPGGAGADLFSFIPAEATPPVPLLLESYPQDEPQRAIDAFQMDFSGSPEVDALDLFAPLYEAGNPVGVVLPADPRAFFSVPNSDIAAVPSSWFGATTPSAASVLTTQWDPGAGTWSTPSVFLSFAELGLPVSDDIDALAVDFESGLMLFSLVKRPGLTLDEQLQIACWICDGSEGGPSTGIWMTTGGEGEEGVARRLGLTAASGDVDGLCTEDPGAQPGAIEPISFGRPVGRATLFTELAANIYKDDDDPSGPRITLTATGMPMAPLPSEVLTAWAIVQLPGGGIVGPRLIYLEGLLPGMPPTRTLSITAPELGLSLGLYADVWFTIFGGDYKRSSPIVRLDL